MLVDYSSDSSMEEEQKQLAKPKLPDVSSVMSNIPKKFMQNTEENYLSKFNIL